MIRRKSFTGAACLNDNLHAVLNFLVSLQDLVASTTSAIVVTVRSLRPSLNCCRSTRRRDHPIIPSDHRGAFNFKDTDRIQNQPVSHCRLTDCPSMSSPSSHCGSKTGPTYRVHPHYIPTTSPTIKSNASKMNDQTGVRSQDLIRVKDT